MNRHSDIVVVGAGPAGLSFARTLADSGLRITIVEKSPLESISNPAYDGREIALTHLSKEIMERLGMWQRVPENEIYPLRDAKVWNGSSSYQLHFPQPTQARGGATDRLGNLISNHNIRKAAYDAVAEQDNVTLLAGVGVKEARTDADGAYITLDNGEQLTARLLVAADSRFSQTRRQIGISADMHDFGRTVIVCRFKHEISNCHTAVEFFQYGRTLALLPLEEHLTNCVITIDSDKAGALLAMSPEELAADLEKQLKNKLGKMEKTGTLHTYPLVGVSRPPLLHHPRSPYRRCRSRHAPRNRPRLQPRPGKCRHLGQTRHAGGTKRPRHRRKLPLGTLRCQTPTPHPPALSRHQRDGQTLHQRSHPGQTAAQPRPARQQQPAAGEKTDYPPADRLM